LVQIKSRTKDMRERLTILFLHKSVFANINWWTEIKKKYAIFIGI